MIKIAENDLNIDDEPNEKPKNIRRIGKPTLYKMKIKRKRKI